MGLQFFFNFAKEGSGHRQIHERHLREKRAREAGRERAREAGRESGKIDGRERQMERESA
jgi:hypothetical protein